MGDGEGGTREKVKPYYEWTTGPGVRREGLTWVDLDGEATGVRNKIWAGYTQAGSYH